MIDMKALMHEFYRSTLEQTDEGIYFVDRNRQITFWNKGAERISGFSAEEVVGKHCYDNILNHVDDEGTQLCLTGCPLLHTIRDGKKRSTHVYLHHKNGQRVRVNVRTVPLYFENGIIGAVEYFREAIEQNQLIQNVLGTADPMQEEDIHNLKLLALYDQLTGLPNRRFLDSQLKRRYEDARELGMPMSVIYADIDDFSAINNQYGHQIGDEVLRSVSISMVSAMRGSDIVGRYGGEEFIAIVHHSDFSQACETAEKMRMLVEKTVIRTPSVNYHTTISLGITQLSENDSLEEVIARADAALYKSKQNGKNKVTIG